jgi:hypothetical protein
VKLRNNASHSSAVLSEAYEEKLRKSKAFLSGINDSKRVARTWKIMKELVVQDRREPMKIWCIHIGV